MRKASRLFEIVQILRLAKAPLTAQQVAERMEVTQRSIYRDIAELQAMRVPIEGERGIGYILRPGFTLPPLMFTIEETEAIILALALLQRTADAGLKCAARQVHSKITAVLPAPINEALAVETIHAWGTIATPPPALDLSTIREAIRVEQKLRLAYRDVAGRKTERVICPFALVYYSEATNIVAWCELRDDVRYFRAERVLACTRLDEYFTGEGKGFRELWADSW